MISLRTAGGAIEAIFDVVGCGALVDRDVVIVYSDAQPELSLECCGDSYAESPVAVVFLDSREEITDTSFYCLNVVFGKVYIHPYTRIAN